VMAFIDFDAFRRPPTDLHEKGTLGGSVLTLLSALFLAALLTWHTVVFVAFPTTETELVVERFRKDKVQIQLALDVKIPCPLIDLEVHNALGTHTIDFSRNLSKLRLDSNGQQLKEADAMGDLAHHQLHEKSKTGTGLHESYFEETHKQLDSLGDSALELLDSMVNDDQWCRINGTVTVPKLPGKLFLRSHHAELAKMSPSRAAAGEFTTAKWYNTSHLIHRFRVLDTSATAEDLGELSHDWMSPFSLQFIVTKTESEAELIRKIMVEPNVNWRYDLQVVGSRNVRPKDKKRHVYHEKYKYTLGQYSYAAPADRSGDEHAEPLSLSFTFSPVTIMTTTTYQSTMSFLSGLLGSLGGCFALLKFLDNSIFIGRNLVVKGRAGKIV